MIVEEDKKKEKKNENFLVDLCECHLLLKNRSSYELLSICIHCLLKAASVKEESEENQKEVEIALLTLSHIDRYYFIRQELYLKEITEIIKNHQEHRNLTQLAYQSAWEFLINRFNTNKFLEDTVSNELHFGREAARELEELTRNVNWKKKEEEMSKEEAKEVLIIKRWIETIVIYFFRCELWNEELVELIRSISYVYLAAKDDYSIISYRCIYFLRNAAKLRFVRVEDLLKGGAVEAVLEEMQRPTLKKVMTNECCQFFMNVSNRLNEKTVNKMEEVNRKATKRKVYEKLEEEGYEDIIVSF
ncbi:uncharacterized protein MONOS_13826 [Monocercomonoides exilis]|uniref:uncharacterized protein n=1 Tax=Monocercomonoides exilis TaxID=2049356 RepID=UPI003559FDD1|nr:hypothetical protein MONOS_13826 [Monocercomonoides exilis]|eukprot:MONOS_13826.1-p1 / transcript=MONOS_13826.1 / gene=MONOS_13826 / organism=Monocercomonoides_exilis_PA203 / gene_product=unspecified product / transcript_product=unspecified product / location=Mono_scaffold00890:13203-14168(+) / protein_length=303 / sequence_SO=supercontig / SO=protein_coding / is_pseudo=false